MIETPRLVRSPEQVAAVIRFTIPRAEIRQVMGPAIGEVIAAVTAQGVGPAGPVFSHHFRMDPDVFDFEVGVPVSAPVSPVGRVVASALPDVQVVRTIHSGPYEGLGAGWSELEKWMASEGLTPAPDLWERYLQGPESGRDPSEWRTELNRPLAPKI